MHELILRFSSNMIFSDLLFLYIFLPLLFLLYYPIKSIHWRNAVLTVFSLFFYAWGEPKYVFLMIGCVLLNYFSGLIISHLNENGNSKLKKFSLIIAVALNLGVLVFYKYTGLFADTFENVTGLTLSISDIALPLGISFFTFQSLSYTIDVYRGETPVQKNLGKLLLYVSLFPQLIAGPIVRYHDVCEQIDCREITVEKINDGIFRFCIGLAKKVLIANPCGNAADKLLGMSIGEATVASGWIGALFYAMQIYYDFSGYSDMAIGLGKMFGFDFLENFNYPYISKSATEFWRRWHISLGTFFRDYVYIPLGGNRHAWLRNVLIVWLLTGFWHGASWNYLLWGLYYGILLLFEKKLLLPLAEKINKTMSSFLLHIYTVIITLVGWTIFYYESGLLTHLGVLFGVNANLGDIYELSVLKSNLWLLLTALLFSTPLIKFLISKLSERFSENTCYFTSRFAKTIFILLSLFLCTAMLAGNSYNPFIYSRF